MHGTDITREGADRRVHRGIAYVPQGRMIFSTMTVQENVETGLTVTGESEVPDDIYELFPVLLFLDCMRKVYLLPFCLFIFMRFD